MAETSNERILDRYIRHQTDLFRYAAGLRDEMLPKLAETELDLFNTILSYTARADGDRSLMGAAGPAWQKELGKEIANTRRPAWDDIIESATAQFKELAVVEAAAGATVIESSVPVLLNMALPPTNQLLAIVRSRPFEGRTLKEWMERTAAQDVDRILTQAKIGISDGLTPTEIARNVIGSRRAKYKDGKARKAFTDLEAVLLTVTNGIQNDAKQMLYAENADIIDRELFVATLDIRTTLECGANDGKTFKRGEGPIPPLHFRCRSLRVPVINPDALGKRGFDSSTEKQLIREYNEENGLTGVKARKYLPRGHKTKFDTFSRKRMREMVGQVPGDMDYTTWLKKQSVEFQNARLGIARGEMFRKGEFTLDKFVARTGDVLTLDELKRLSRIN